MGEYMGDEEMVSYQSYISNNDSSSLDCKLDNYIDGQFVPPSTGKYTEIRSPADGKSVAKLASSDSRDVDSAVLAAASAQAKYGLLSVFERRKLVKSLAKVLMQRADDFARAESLDMGKPLASSSGDDLKRQIRNLRYHAEAASHAPGQSSLYETDESFERRATEAPRKSYVNYTTRHPIGVVAIIAHWSRPLHQIIWRLAPALVAGNSVVIKPASCTPLTAYMLGTAVADAGFPPGVVNIVFGPGPIVGTALARHKKVAALAMVGGNKAAAAIASEAAASGSMKKLKFDLGNNHAMVVMPDADQEESLSVAVAACFLCDMGQRAHSVGRLILHKDIAQEFTDKFVAKANALLIGDPTDASAEVGPLVTQKQVKLMSQGVKELQAAGGSVLCGGDSKPPRPALADGFWFSPTVIGGFTFADAHKPAVTKEHQGPIVKIIVVESAAEAVAAANAGEFGLSASVWSSDNSQAHSIAHALDAGYVWVNNWLLRDLSMPFGGWKGSGNGQRSGGAFDVDFYSNTKTICMQIQSHKSMFPDKSLRESVNSDEPIAKRQKV